MDGSKAEHLSPERISMLLDEPWADMEAQGHLETCDACRAEFERMSRIRMATSALGELEPPIGEWAAIEAALDRARVGAGAGPVRGFARRLMVSGPLQAAAALALFTAGVVAGLQFTGGGIGGPPAAGSDLPAVISATGDDRLLFDGLTQLESLGAPLRQAGLGADRDALSGADATDAAPDPFAAAERALRLDALIQAMRDRLEEDPDDIVASAFLVEYVEERARLAEELERSFRTRGTVRW